MKNSNLLYFNSAATKLMPTLVQKAFIASLENPINLNRSNQNSNLLSELKVDLSNLFGGNKDNYHLLGTSTTISNYLAELLFHNQYLTDGFWYSKIDHHSLFTPFLVRSKGYILELDDQFNYCLNSCFNNAKVLLLTLSDNLRGSLQKIKPLIQKFKKLNPAGIVIVDACQAVCNYPLDCSKLNCDFLFFSIHKIYGPAGVGVLYAKNLTVFKNFYVGGGNCRILNNELVISNNLEIGTLNYPSFVATKVALDYFKNNHDYPLVQNLKNYFVSKIKTVPGYYLIAEQVDNLSCLIAHHSIHAHDLMTYLAKHQVIVRAGEMCNSNFTNLLGTSNLLRISFDFHNTFKQIDQLIEILKTDETTILNTFLDDL